MSHESEPLDPPGTHSDAAPPNLSAAQKRAALVAAALLGLATLWIAAPFLPAIGWALVAGVSLWPLHERARAATPRWRREAMPALIVLLVALAFVVPMIAVVRLALRDWVEVSTFAQQVNATGMPAPAALAHWPFGDRLVALWQANLAEPGVFGRLSEKGGEGIAGGLGAGRHLLGAVAHRLVLVSFMLLALFFLLRDGDHAASALRIGARRAFGPSGEHVGEQMVRAVRGTVNGLVIVGLLEGVIMGLTYELCGVPHPALLGLVTGLLSVVPMGSLLAIAAAAALVAAAGATVAAVIVAAVGGVVVFVADHFIRPVLIGGATRLPFVWVLLGILGGIETVGLIGLVLGPALMAALLLLWREWTGQVKGPLNPVEGKP